MSGLRDVPSLGPLRRSGRVLRIARRSAARDPRQQRRNLLRAKRRIIGEMPESRIGKPRRHHSALDRLGDGGRPGPRLLVGHQRHRRDFARPVTALAMLLKQGKNVLVESGELFSEGAGVADGGSRRKRSRTGRDRTPIVYKAVILSAETASLRSCFGVEASLGSAHFSYTRSKLFLRTPGPLS